MIEESISIFASHNPSKVAFVIDGIFYSYAFLNEKINSYAYSFMEDYSIGVQDRVILYATRSIDFISCYFALHRIGAIAIPVDEHIAAETLNDIIEQTLPTLVVGHELMYDQLLNGVSSRTKEFPTFSTDDVADIMFTSGTTGTAKGVTLSHTNIEASAQNIAGYIGNTENDTEVLALPLCHSFALGRIRSVMLNGGTIYLHDGFSNVKSLFRLLESSNATGFSMVPAGWNLIKKLSGTRISKFADSLKYIEMGSSYLSADDKKELADLLPHTRLCMHYGLTEASRSVFMEFHSDSLESVGKPLPNVSVKILSNGELTTKEDVEGEICIAGKHVTHGYWHRDDLQNEVFVDGYIRTGDVGYFWEGNLYISGRLKDIINVGGKKVSAKEIEDVAMRFGGIEECACVGKKDPLLIEVPYLVIVAKTVIDKDSLLLFYRRNVEEYKIPQEIIQIESLPKTHNGKIQKHKLLNE